MKSFSLARLWAIMRKEFRHILRDRRLLFLVTVSPAIMLTAFAYVFSFDLNPARFAIYDQDRSPQSRNLVAALSHDRNLIVLGEVDRYEDLRQGMAAGEIKVGLVIPPGFGRDLQAGHRTSVQVLAEGSDAINASTQMAILSSRISEWGQQYETLDIPQPVELRAITLYNPDIKGRYSMVPALLAIAMILPSMAVALALAREKELGSFESLAATPVRAVEYIPGKLIPYIIFGLISAALAVAVAVLWFKVPMKGTYLDLAGFTTLYLWATLGISILLSNFITNQSTALRAVLLLFLVPSFFLTGLIVPIDEQARFVAFTLPATHYVAINRAVFLKGQGWDALGMHAFVLLSMGLFATLFTILTFRKRVG
ncbi:MAG TPA: ABC transporter permease [Anaerolineae bacterium]|nr:ABC transporter permease [Anaerolineae bacterium]